MKTACSKSTVRVTHCGPAAFLSNEPRGASPTSSQPVCYTVGVFTVQSRDIHALFEVCSQYFYGCFARLSM